MRNEQAKKHWYILVVCLLGAFNTSYADCGTCQQPFCCSSSECCPIVCTICPECDPTSPSDMCAVVCSPCDSGPGSLRCAIEEANVSEATKCNPFAIVFNLNCQACPSCPGCPGDVCPFNPGCPTCQEGGCPCAVTDPCPPCPIVICTPLPPIKKPVCINGFTNPCADDCVPTITVEILPITTSNIDYGLVLNPAAAGSTIKGISIGGFREAQIRNFASCIAIFSNYIGVRKDGITTYNNTGDGIRLESGSCITIGGTCPQRRNIISGTQNGIDVQTHGVTIVGNYIGLDATGTTAVNNIETGITMSGSNNFIGCLDACARNIISATGDETSVEGIGVKITNSSLNQVTNNFFGTDINCKNTAALSNKISILVENSANTTVAGNVVAGSEEKNIHLTQSSFNKLCRNVVGADCTSNIAAQTPSNDPTSGFTLERSPNNTIKDNVISVKGGVGIEIINSAANTVVGNRIGTNNNGTGAVGPQSIGIYLCSTTGITGECGVSTIIDAYCSSSSSTTTGVKPLTSQKTGSSGGTATDCSSGMCIISDPCPNPTATTVLPNPFDTINNCIIHNLISGNECAGIALQGARKTLITKNKIGLNGLEPHVKDPSNPACGFQTIPNAYGIVFAEGAQTNCVTDNKIIGNNFNGIVVGQPNAETDLLVPFKDSILDNVIFLNGDSGILLVNQGNRCQAAPVLTSASQEDDCLIVEGTLDITCHPQNPYLIEVYGNPCCRVGIGEGAVLLGCQVIQDLSTEPQTSLPFTVELQIPSWAALSCVTATATLINSDNKTFEDTSEYSCPVDIGCCL